MATDSFKKALDRIDKRTAHLTDEAFSQEIDLIIQDVRKDPPAPTQMLQAVYRTSVENHLFEVSLTPTS